MKLIIDELTDNIRIDTYLADYMQDFSRSKIQSEIKELNENDNFNEKLVGVMKDIIVKFDALKLFKEYF